jgi:hypothetical protein
LMQAVFEAGGGTTRPANKKKFLSVVTESL